MSYYLWKLQKPFIQKIAEGWFLKYNIVEGSPYVYTHITCVKRRERDPPSPRRTPQSDGPNCTNPTKLIEKSRPSDQSRSRRVKPHFPSHQSDTDPSYFGVVLRNPNPNPNPSPWSGSPSPLRPWRRRRPWRTSRLTSSWRRTPLTSSDPERFDPLP